MEKKSAESLLATNGHNGVEHWATGVPVQARVSYGNQASKENIQVMRQSF